MISGLQRGKDRDFVCDKIAISFIYIYSIYSSLCISPLWLLSSFWKSDVLGFPQFACFLSLFFLGLRKLQTLNFWFNSTLSFDDFIKNYTNGLQIFLQNWSVHVFIKNKVNKSASMEMIFTIELLFQLVLLNIQLIN